MMEATDFLFLMVIVFVLIALNKGGKDK